VGLIEILVQGTDYRGSDVRDELQSWHGAATYLCEGLEVPDGSKRSCCLRASLVRGARLIRFHLELLDHVVLSCLVFGTVAPHIVRVVRLVVKENVCKVPSLERVWAPVDHRMALVVNDLPGLDSNIPGPSVMPDDLQRPILVHVLFRLNQLKSYFGSRGSFVLARALRLSLV
jgi:hypothetical protein